MSRKTLLSILFGLGLGFTACGGGREDPVAAEIGTEEGAPDPGRKWTERSSYSFKWLNCAAGNK